MSQSEVSRVVEMSVDDAYRFLRERHDAQLVDVRTRAEWSFAGAPLLPFRDETPIFIEWQRWPDMQLDPDFVRQLQAELDRRGVGAQAPLLFLCRSGQRSRAAAQAMLTAGRTHCVNVSEGFQGPLDAESHRGRISGWQAAGLPWRQS